jgi:hypothetical protein
MSTKTTFKRVALVAVAALGFGMLSVVPSNAADIAPTALSAGDPTPARIGVLSSTDITASHIAFSGSGAFYAAAKITAAPATSKLRSTDTSTASLGVAISGDGTSTVSSKNYGIGTTYATVTQADGTLTAVGFVVDFTADVAGTYQILVSASKTNTSYTAGDASTVLSITTVGAPTKISVASLGGAVTTGSAITDGQLFSVTLTDANGNDTVLAADEGIAVTSNDATVTVSDAALAAGDSTDGEYLVHAYQASAVAAGSATITFKGTGLLSSTLVTNVTATKVVTTTMTTDTVICTTSTQCPSDTAALSNADVVQVASAPGLTIGGADAASGTAAKYFHITILNDATTYKWASFMTQAAVATGGTALTTLAYTPGVSPSALGEVDVDFGSKVITFQYEKPAAKTIALANTTNTVLSALAGTNTFVAKVTDQYGSAVANTAVTVKVSGRNTVATKTLGVTDANGLISYSLTDAGTTGTADTVTFTATVSVGGTGSALAYVNYGTVTVDTVTVSGGSKAETVVGSTLTSISGADNGPETSAVAIKAVVKDASGNLLAGVPVVFTVSSGLIKKTASVDYATVYTGSDGAASTSVFDWKSGTQTITATAGGKSSTDYLTWAANVASNARVLSAVATGDIVSLKVVDRFGNAVQGVTINLSRTGAGLFGNGASTQNIDTDKNGTADVRFTGSGTVIAELAATYAQAYATAGNITTKAATAATAGTTAGTGATLTPAGVSKVSIAIEESANSTLAAATAASDAAAEATDAANAATDAANAAAEAADAATAAAQDAADAVAALATQVTEMMDAMKKQITALTNLVIKIQKKVKA